MLDRTKLPRSFSVAYQDAAFDFVVTNASDDSALVLNAGRDGNNRRLHYANCLTVDRHAGQFHFSDEISADLHALRPLAMKLNAIPAKLLGFAWRMVGGLLGSGPNKVLVGGGDFAMGWNIGVLIIMIGLLALAATIGLYVVLPLLVIASVSFVLDLVYFQPEMERRSKAFMEAIAEQTRDLVEDTVSC